MTLSQTLTDSEQGVRGEERPEMSQSGNKVCVCVCVCVCVRACVCNGCGKVVTAKTIGAKVRPH